MTLSKEELADKYADSQNLHMIGDWRKTDSSEYAKDRRGFLSGFTAAESRYKEALEIALGSLIKLRDGPGNNMVSWKQTWASEYAALELAKIEATIRRRNE